MTDQNPDPHVLAPGQAPTPFTAEEIRAATRVGKSIRRRVDQPGEASYLLDSTYVECDEAGGTLERTRLSLDEEPLGDAEVDRATWLDLQSHASFPADATTIESERIETAIGELDCLRYTVRDGSTERVFWFAVDLPGMPIQIVTRTDGHVVMSSTVVSYDVG